MFVCATVGLEPPGGIIARVSATTAQATPQLAIFTEAVDWGGTERGVQALADRVPTAPIFANHFPNLTAPGVEPLPWTGRVRLVPSGRRKRHFLGPLYARRLAETPVGAARVVLTLASGGWALAAPVPPGGRHVCYLT